MCKTPGKQTTKPKLVQHTLAFGSSLRVGGALGRSPLEATVSAVRTALTEAAAESVRAVAEAASEKAIKVKMEPRGCFDPARPVRVQFAPGFGRIRVVLSTRRPIELAGGGQRKRAAFREADKIAVLKQTKEMTPGQAAAQISSMVGWQKVDSSAVGRWRRQYASQLAAGPSAGGITKSRRVMLR